MLLIEWWGGFFKTNPPFSTPSRYIEIQEESPPKEKIINNIVIKIKRGTGWDLGRVGLEDCGIKVIGRKMGWDGMGWDVSLLDSERRSSVLVERPRGA